MHTHRTMTAVCSWQHFNVKYFEMTGLVFCNRIRVNRYFVISSNRFRNVRILVRKMTGKIVIKAKVI